MKLPATDLSRNALAADELKALIEKFQKHDNYVKVLTEVNNSSLGETDFVFRIVGQYKHNN